MVLTFCTLKLKTDYDKSMVWGSNQVEDFDYSAQPCAKPGCTPFPHCCVTDSIRDVRPDSMSWAIL